MLAQRPFIVPIPGTTKLHRLEENIGAADIALDDDALENIEQAIAGIEINGGRYAPLHQARIDRKTGEHGATWLRQTMPLCWRA